MFAKIKRFFYGPTPEEAYENGKQCANKMLKDGMAAGKRPDLVAEHIYAMGFGGFNETAAHKAFDRGVQHQLASLGYECPY